MSSIVGGAYNMIASEHVADANKKSATETNKVNKEIAEENLGFQKEALDYQKALQQQIFDREDSAYQRTVQDMRAAGMSPLALQGTNSAGEAIQVGALNNQFQAQSPAPRVAPDISGLGGAIEDIFNIAQRYQELKQSKMQTSFEEQTLGDRVAFQRGLTLLQSYDMFDKQQKRNFDDYFGTNSDMTPQERFTFVMRKIINPTNDGSFHASIGHPFSKSHAGISNMFNYPNVSFDSMAKNMIDKFEDYAKKIEQFNNSKNENGSKFGYKDLVPLLQFILN